METSNGAGGNMGQNGPAKQPGSGNKVLYVVAGIIILALIAWFAMSKKSANNEPAQTKSGQNSAPNKEQVLAKNQSLKELIASGVSQKCDFTFQNENIASNGRVYLSRGKMRGYFDAMDKGKEMKTNMLNDGQNVYVWIDDQTTGYKMSASAMMDKPATASQAPKTVDQNAKYDYSCIERGVEDSVFQLPGGVNFTDMSAMMQNQMNASTSAGSAGASAGIGSSAKAQQCAACGSLSGDQKTQCLTALQCP